MCSIWGLLNDCRLSGFTFMTSKITKNERASKSTHATLTSVFTLMYRMSINRRKEKCATPIALTPVPCDDIALRTRYFVLPTAFYLSILVFFLLSAPSKPWSETSQVLAYVNVSVFLMHSYHPPWSSLILCHHRQQILGRRRCLCEWIHRDFPGSIRFVFIKTLS